MRRLAALLCFGVAGCASEPLPETPAPPTAAMIARRADDIAKEAKLPPPLEVSPVRAAHPLSPGDWVFCLKSGAPDQRLRYAIFYKKEYVASRIAVAIDGCSDDTYSVFTPAK